MNYSSQAGVHWHKKDAKWHSTISYNGVRQHLGCFDKVEDAVAARLEAEKHIPEPTMSVYALCDKDGSPMYIGAGSESRLQRWGRPSYWQTHANQPVARRLIEIGYLPEALRLVIDVPPDMAYLWEVALIESIGRVVTGDGPLLNLSRGGPGRSIDGRHPERWKHQPRDRSTFTEHQLRSIAKAHL